jgi:flagellar hook-associated protein 3 FlgL
MIRVTSNMLLRQVLSDSRRITARQGELLALTSRGHRVARPSDDPVAMAELLRRQAAATTLERRQTSLAEGQAFLEATETMLDGSLSILQRARELALQGSSDTLPPETRQALATEVESLRQQLVDQANSQHQEIYLLSGHQTHTQPFNAAEGSASPTSPPELASGGTGTRYVGDSGQRLVFLPEGEAVPVNLTGEEVFVQGQNVFAALENLRDRLQAGATDEIASASLTEIDASLDQLNHWRTVIGGRLTRLEEADQRAETALYESDLRRAALDEVDLAAVALELNLQNLVQQALYTVTPQVLQSGLIDRLA